MSSLTTNYTIRNILQKLPNNKYKNFANKYLAFVFDIWNDVPYSEELKDFHSTLIKINNVDLSNIAVFSEGIEVEGTNIVGNDRIKLEDINDVWNIPENYLGYYTYQKTPDIICAKGVVFGAIDLNGKPENFGCSNNVILTYERQNCPVKKITGCGVDLLHAKSICYYGRCFVDKTGLSNENLTLNLGDLNVNPIL